MRIYRLTSFYILFFHLLSFEKCFLFSVIIAIYNAGRYLDDSICSLINQTIGLEKIQIILINDGSTDETEEICLKYQKKYKKNIIYFKIKHSGVSKARNIGMNYANGTFINFLDADDKWDNQAFYFFSLFLKMYNDIDIVSGRIKFFGEEKRYHPLDYKFYKTRVINLTKEYNSIQLSASSSIFRKSSIKDKNFKEDVFFCEDSLFVNNFLLHKPIMGILKEAIYYYRRRADFSSAINTQKKNVDYYLGTLEKVSLFLINSSKAIFNSILPFIQFLIIYDLLWRIQSYAFLYLDLKNFKRYKCIIDKLLKEIDDKYIFEQKTFSYRHKMFILSKKYKRDLRYDIKLRNNSFIYSNKIIIDLESENSIIEWRILDIKNNKIYLEGIDNFWLPREKFNYFIKIGNEIFYPTYYPNARYDFYTMYGLSQKGRTIFFEIPINIKDESQILYFYIDYMGTNIEIFPSLGLFSHIPFISNGYFTTEKYIIAYFYNRLTVFHYNKALEEKFENYYCYELKKRNKEDIIDLRRYIKHKKKSYKNYEIWIINDEYDKAGSNGEYFFRYLNLKKPEGIKVYFAIKKECYDYKRLKQFGNILDLESIEYKKKFLESNKIISSISDSWVDNPFEKDKIYIRDLLHFDFIYLSNDINLQNSINRMSKNYSLIVVSSKNEYKSILGFNYHKNNVFLTGMPKFDYLNNFKNMTEEENKVVIIPTLRESFKEILNLKNNNSIYFNRFQSIKFFEFYNHLMNDQQLLSIMKQYNYKGFLCLNSSFQSDWLNFHQNGIFSVIESCDYNNFLFSASLFVIDYSNIFLDIGYIKKPIIYAHFDYEEYKDSKILNHQKKLFDYQNNGFGPVCNNLKCTIIEIISEIKNKCLLRKKYLKRIKKYFAFSHCNFSEKIFSEIIKKKEIIKKENNCFLINSVFLFFVLILLFKFL